MNIREYFSEKRKIKLTAFAQKQRHSARMRDMECQDRVHDREQERECKHDFSTQVITKTVRSGGGYPDYDVVEVIKSCSKCPKIIVKKI